MTTEILDEILEAKDISKEILEPSYDETSLALMTVKQLKVHAMVQADRLNHKKSWIQTCSKEVLMEYLKSGNAPDIIAAPAERNSNGNSNGHEGANPDLGSVLASAIAPFLTNLTSKVDESDVIRIVEERLESFREPRLIQVIDVKRMTLSDASIQHKQFAKLLAYVSQRENVYLVGPAASGKTQAAENVATVLGLEFSSISVCAQTPVSAFFGFMNAVGVYVTTEFRKRFELGGIFLCDEFDNGNANTAAALNQASANGVCAFPDGMIKKHPDFVLICAGNTFGTGADRQYVGRNQLDAATLDRFAFLDWEYDEDLERAITEGYGHQDWVKHVQSSRHAAQELKIRHVISVRSSIKGSKMLAAGLGWQEVEKDILWKGLAKEEISKIVARMALQTQPQPF